MTEPTTRQLLVRSGGRCALCYSELLTSEFTQQPVYLGERAHIVGRSTSTKSPRGDYDLPIELRDDPENLLLLCRSCHGEIDTPPNISTLTVQRLREAKQQHESRIAQILSVPPGRDTAVLRMQGTIGNSNVALDRSVAASAVLAQGRCARFPLSHDAAGIEIDLRRVPSPHIGSREYYDTCRGLIDRVFDRQVAPAVEERNPPARKCVRARPLACAGPSRRALGRQARCGHLPATPRNGVVGLARPTVGESVLRPDRRRRHPEQRRCARSVDVSGRPRSRSTAVSQGTAASITSTPASGCSAHPDVVDSPAALKSAERALRDVLADIEQHSKAARRLHVLGARAALGVRRPGTSGEPRDPPTTDPSRPCERSVPTSHGGHLTCSTPNTSRPS